MALERVVWFGGRERVVPGSEAAARERFDRTWQQHRERVWRLVARLAGSADRADDLTQEVCLRAFQAFGNFRGEAAAYTWFYRIAVNVVLRDRERRRETVPLEAPEAAQLRASEATCPEAQALRAELRPAVWAALERLPEEQRTTLILQVYEGLKYREIARILDIPIGTVASRLNLALRRLREELKDHAL